MQIVDNYYDFRWNKSNPPRRVVKFNPNRKYYPNYNKRKFRQNISNKPVSLPKLEIFENRNPLSKIERMKYALETCKSVRLAILSLKMIPNGHNYKKFKQI